MNDSTQLTITISDLTFDCIIGILPQERVNKQRVIINCSFEYEYRNNSFINYADVAHLIEKKMIEKKFELIEDALLYIKEELSLLYKLYNLKLSISKPDILNNCSVSVSL